MLVARCCDTQKEHLQCHPSSVHAAAAALPAARPSSSSCRMRTRAVFLRKTKGTSSPSPWGSEPLSPRNPEVSGLPLEASASPHHLGLPGHGTSTPVKGERGCLRLKLLPHNGFQISIPKPHRWSYSVHPLYIFLSPTPRPGSRSTCAPG